MLDPDRLDGPALATAIRETLRFRPQPAGLRLDGASETAELLMHLVSVRTGVAAA